MLYTRVYWCISYTTIATSYSYGSELVPPAPLQALLADYMRVFPVEYIVSRPFIQERASGKGLFHYQAYTMQKVVETYMMC